MRSSGPGKTRSAGRVATRRGGFTLLELMIAIVIGSVVALLAYATLRAGVDTGERVQRAGGAVSDQAVVRAVLIDALRHLPEGGGAAMDEPLFTLEDRTSADGLPQDRLRFVSHGVGRAPGAAGAWTVAVAATGDGVVVHAEPSDADDGAPFDLAVAGAVGLDARALPGTPDAAWSAEWDLPGRVPAAVELTFVDRTGRSIGPPVVVRATLERAP